MASIFGVEVKRVNIANSYEGSVISGSVYYHGKKLGHWSQDHYGGDDHFDFDESVLKDALVKYKNTGNIPAEFVNCYDEGLLLEDVVNLKFVEKKYKNAVKRGMPYMLEVNGYWGSQIVSSSKPFSKADIEKHVNEYRKNSKIKLLYDIKTYLYACEDDFNIK